MSASVRDAGGGSTRAASSFDSQSMIIARTRARANSNSSGCLSRYCGLTCAVEPLLGEPLVAIFSASARRLPGEQAIVDRQADEAGVTQPLACRDRA
jgi:hypothetical protein